MKSCLKCSTESQHQHPPPQPHSAYSTPPDSPSETSSDCSDAPPPGAMQRRKSVTFCEVGESDIFYVDDWDRSPAAVTERLTYRDVYELKEMHIALPRIQLTRRKS